MRSRPARAGRVRRLFDGRPNELRRPVDRTRRRWNAVFVLSFLIALVCGGVVSTAVWDAESREARETARHRHQIAATTVGAAERAVTSRSGGTARVVAPAEWEYPAAHQHSDRVSVPFGTPAGRTVTIWVDDAGTEVQAPPPDGQRAFTAAAAGIGAFGLLALASGAAVRMRVRLVETRTLAEWEHEWEAVEPRWSGRPRRERGPGDD
ncbi:Rv1733c family protein [Streptomyces erythrochromogenes]|uniref:Rv1733c family protein n=1 Tax=Streptomyces erythrochromogenes TaxID=285574 RepID=UPI0037FDB846